MMESTTESAYLSTRAERERMSEPIKDELAEIKRLLGRARDTLEKPNPVGAMNVALRLGAIMGYMELALRHVKALEREVSK